MHGRDTSLATAVAIAPGGDDRRRRGVGYRREARPCSRPARRGERPAPAL